MISIVALTPDEKFLQFIDENLIEITETIEYGGLRTINVDYTFQDLSKDKELFKLGNKLWIQGDTNLSDCLYVINTKVTENVYEKNLISFEAEEVLVELNYAPLFTQNELSLTIDNTPIFTPGTGTGEVVVNWNALNYWFGDYYNIAVVQDCISTYAQKITITGTMTRMSILRQIEEETGNVFVTRYEKNPLNNTIHRYLDFLNPINVNKPWILNTEYSFINTAVTGECYDENGNVTTEDKPWEATPYWNSEFEPIPESVDTTIPTESETEGTYELHTDSEKVDDDKDYTPLTDINPTNIIFRIMTDDGIQLTDANDNDLSWTASDIGFDENTPEAVIQLVKTKTDLELLLNSKSFLVETSTQVEAVSTGFLMTTPASDPDNKRETPDIPDNSYFEIYDQENNVVIHRVMINNQIGTVHDEVLDFGFNLENVIYDVDETDTYTAVAPVLQLNDSDGGLSRKQLGDLIDKWKSLSISKGNTVPMIVERATMKSAYGTLAGATAACGTYSLSSNYFIRPYNPQDNTSSSTNSDKTFEFLRATAYWKAPYTKKAGELYVSTDNTSTEYGNIYTRNDTRLEKGAVMTPKIGTTESTDEDVYQIYNQVCQYLKEHETPNIDVQVDVANLRKGKNVQYDLHDKVYIKLPDSQELVTARVIKTEKEAHDIAKNTITLSNYVTKNTLKTPIQSTFLTANNLKFKYPNTKTLTATLTNADYDNTDSDSVEHPAIKLLTFTIYSVDNGSRTFTGKVYTRKTNAYGQASIVLNLDPGTYDIDISFGGDELYSQSQITSNIVVTGTKEVPAQMTTKTTNAKTTAKTSTTTKTIKTYWTKCGLSPDKSNKIVSVAKPSASNSDMQKYGVKATQLYKTVFKNKCPECGRTGTLRFDGGKANKCLTSTGARGRGYKINVPEHEITCNHCDSDFDGVTGLEKDSGHSTRLKMLEKPKKATKSDFAKLTKGQLVYKVTTKTQTDKANTDTRTSRKYRSASLSNTIKNLAKTIVGDSIGLTAAKKIANYCDHKIAYHKYKNFVRSPDQVYDKKGGNCCDVTRFFFALCDAAGCCEHLDLYYIHVQCPKYGHVYGKVVTKKTGKYRYVDNASDYHVAWGYVISGCPKSSTPASKYPKLPF